MGRGAKRRASRHLLHGARGAEHGAVVVEADAILYEEMKRTIRFSEEDARALLELYPHAAPLFEGLAGAFCVGVREHASARDRLEEDAQIEGLRTSFLRWLRRLFTGPRDAVGFTETATLGQGYVRVGLPLRQLLIAIAPIREALAEHAAKVLGDRAPAASLALHRALDLELAVMSGAYEDDRAARAEWLTRVGPVSRSLARTEQRYQNAVELARVMFIGLDARGVIRLCNHEAERVTAHGRDELLGTRFVELLPEGAREEHGPIFELAARGEAPAPEVIEGAIRTRVGQVRDVRWQIACSGSTAEDEVVLFLVGQDMTEQNALTARTRRAEKLAAVSTLAAGLAHEIRNPLNGAHLHLTVLERGLKRAGVSDPDTHDAVRVVGQEIHRLSDLLSEFLDFARPKPLKKEPCSLPAVCTRAVQLVTLAAKTAGTAIVTQMPEAELALEADAAKVEQALVNLLENAIDATSLVGGGSVSVRLKRQGRRAVIEVEDDGPGLIAADTPIFDAFFSTKPQGTGLGLTIAHRIVTDHGGDIDVTSQPGKTIFRIALPIPDG